ncbi:MAG: trigger factor [bacterium]
MKTAVTQLEQSRVRIEAAIPAAEVAKRMDAAARELAGEMRLPGFRKGKVPTELVVQRIGRDAVLEQALRSALGEWYERALIDAGVAPVGEPKLDVAELPGPGEDLAFSIEVGVTPTATLGEYKGLEVGKGEPEVSEEAIQGELDRLREGFASLEPVDRAAAEGDLVSIDFKGVVDGEAFDGGEGRDQLVELGSGSLVEGFEAGLIGASGGEEHEIEATFPDDYRAQELAGKQATFAVTVNEVREKSLPDLDDSFAAEASEFETLDELRGEISGRIAHALSHRVEDEFREAAVNAAADAAQVEIPEEIVRARAADTWERVERQLAARGVSPDAYLQMQGKTRDELVAEAEPEAERSLRREATLAAVAEAEEIEVSDSDLLAALGPGEGDEDPAKLLARLREGGRDQLLREDVRLRKAADVIVESAKPIPVSQAAAREAIWTPEKGPAEEGSQVAEPEGEPGRIWTPGS